MEVHFETMDQEDVRSTFVFYKQGMMPIISEAIGWDEDFQQERYQNRLHSDWFYWLTQNGQRCGYVCYKYTDTHLHVHLLILFSEYQRKGIGRKVLIRLSEEAHRKNKVLSLSAFKNNLPAIALYQSLGLQILSEDDLFYDFTSVM